MAKNNLAILTGNFGAEATIHESKDKGLMAAFSLATTDSYKDKDDNWQQKKPVWHNILVFNPTLIQLVKSFKKGSRVEITGSISYRPFTTKAKNKSVKKYEASIIAEQIELKPLPKKPKPDAQPAPGQ